MAAIATRPCSGCGRPKPSGQGRKLCDRCQVAAQERKREWERDYQRRRYLANRSVKLAQARSWSEANSERRGEISRQHAQSSQGRNTRLLQKYGITLAEYEATLEAQGGKCAICGRRDNRRLNVDHCHETGRVRGLLCSGCNGASLGRLGHDPERAELRAEYHEDRAFKLWRVAEYLRNPPGVKRGG